jgi:hypothetical protein
MVILRLRTGECQLTGWSQAVRRSRRRVTEIGLKGFGDEVRRGEVWKWRVEGKREGAISSDV